ncbi:MAG: hypothetical protein WBF17_19985 [Phycisphaerae bacterium]
MPGKLLPLVLKNVLRSKTRLLATVGCCMISAAIICFFVTADSSLAKITEDAASSQNLVLTQKDRY